MLFLIVLKKKKDVSKNSSTFFLIQKFFVQKFCELKRRERDDWKCPEEKEKCPEVKEEECFLLCQKSYDVEIKRYKRYKSFIIETRLTYNII